ncbi:hypothetical protein [Amycolatopsis sp. DG1A-15b]|uniref:hypothetical protein n=1 Tax=Amycolatopsis sp. DG1A-15b TaxID=3052846 RepID=UPI00255B8DBF|nr:hypothetical protein [Amycolatopsis sp. DG1A-15b]WIX87340.1 hypothetical protein QRY02_40325 [Amycolatopsis sp. DG1A-15b]
MPEGPIYDPGGDWELPGPNGVPRAGSYGGGGVSGAGFEYDEETLRELMHEWNDLAREFQEDREQARAIATTHGPGLEYASAGNAERIRASGDALDTALQQRAEYCRAMAEKFAKALGKYAATEESHASELKQTEGTL